MAKREYRLKGSRRGQRPSVEQQPSLSRRLLLGTLVYGGLAAGAALPLIGGKVAEAQSKVSKKLAKYQDSPENGKHCSECDYFIKPHSCHLVEGTINPNGWCQFFSNKS